jgi:hypothetical protein
VKKTVIAVCAVVLATASLAEAQATRTWVSGVGDDVNPCSRTAPCKTFAGAISKTAAGGYINALDPGGFGAVTITKSITIDGGGGPLAGVLATSGQSGIIVNSASATVVLRNLSIEGGGTGANGIRVIAAAQVHVERCTIQNFLNNGIVFGASGDLFVTDTTVKQIVDQGVYVQSGRASFDRVTANGNGVGVLAGYSAIVSIKGSAASGNDIGFGGAYSAGAQMNIEDSVASNNLYGILSTAGATVRMSNVSVSNNSVMGLYTDGAGHVVSFGNNRFGGNGVDGTFTSTLSVK